MKCMNRRSLKCDAMCHRMEDMLSELRSVEAMLFTLAMCDVDNLGADHVNTVALSLSAKVKKNIATFEAMHCTLIDGLEALEQERPCSKY